MNITIPWIEKYRPRTIDEIVLKESIRSKLNKMIIDREIPDLIITGSTGTGKTATVQCLVRKLLGRYRRMGLLDLNASDDRGIKAIQESIEHFFKKKDTIDKQDIGRYMKHKIVVLDEIDNMTSKSQQLISKLMQEYNSKIKFIFTCNQSDKIVEGIQSRCSILKYERINKELMTNQLEKICKIENASFTKLGLTSIYDVSNGDLRTAINCLQTVNSAFGKILSKNVYKVCDIPHPEQLEDILIKCSNSDVEALQQMDSLLDSGYSYSDISRGMIKALRLSDKLNEKTKVVYLEQVSRTAIAVSKGVSSKIQIIGCIANLCLLGKPT